MFDIPDLRSLKARAVAAFRAHLPGVDAVTPGNNVEPTATVLSGEIWALFGRLAWVMRQAFPLTAEADNLDRHGAQYGIARRPAAPAAGVITLTHDASVTVAAGAQFARLDGVRYVATIGATAAGAGTTDVDVDALAVGAAGNGASGAPLSIVSGVTTSGAVSAEVGADGVVGGADIESDDALRARILFRLRYPPHGGSAADYVGWAGEVEGVTRTYVERLWNGPGTVRVFPLFDDLRAGGVPLPADIARVSAHLATVQPAAAGVTVGLATAQPINITIAGLSPDTSATRAAVTTALAEVIRYKGRVSGLDEGAAGIEFLADPHVFSRSWLWEAVAAASGEARHVLVAPAADVDVARGAVPTLGTVTFA